MGGDHKIILPPEKSNKTIGRPVVPFRKVLDAILYVLRTGCQWKMLPKEYGSGSTCHRRFQEWVVSDVFKKLWVRLLEVYDDLKGIRLIDVAITRQRIYQGTFRGT
jgi:transposase